MRRVGFTLVDALVAFGVAAIAIALIVPSINLGVTDARRTKSQSFLRLHGQRFHQYALEHQDECINPFSTESRGQLGRRPWVWANPSEPGAPFGAFGWRYDIGGTEAFGFYWLFHLMYEGRSNPARIESHIAPGDIELQLFWRWVNSPQSDWPPPMADYALPTSYWYPPTMWQHHARFANVAVLPASTSNTYFVRRNRISDARFPASKVLFFEPKDFAHRDLPMWLNPIAHPNAATIDGSAREVAMGDVMGSYAPAGAPVDDFRPRWPSGSFHESGINFMNEFRYGSAPEGPGAPRFTWEYLAPGTARPAFFWRTRDGIRGRDLP